MVGVGALGIARLDLESSPSAGFAVNRFDIGSGVSTLFIVTFGKEG